MALSVNAQTMTEWKDLQVNDIHRLPLHTSLFPYESAEASQQCKTKSSRFFSLDGSWKFFWTANANDSLPVGFHSADFDDSTWGTMPVPGIWELNGYGSPEYVNIGFAWRGQYQNNPPVPAIAKNHVGLYRRQIVLPDSWRPYTIRGNGKSKSKTYDGYQYVMHLGSVTSCVYVWVNGNFVGYAEDAKQAAEFDVTPYLKPGVNLVAMQVYRWSDGSYCEDQDFWRLSGIARESYIYRQPRTVRIDNLQLTADATGLLSLSADVTGKADINYILRDKGGNEVGRTTASGTGNIKSQIKIDNPKLWSAETPYLYSITAEVSSPVLRDTTYMVQRVGFRTVEVKNGQLLVNGKAVLIKGIDRHEIDPDGGYVVSMDRMLSDIRRLKEFNFNAVRTCHYPDDPRWYDLCDEYGIYLVGEANVESHGFLYDRSLTEQFHSIFAKQILERNQHNVLTNYNHPSIIVWSLGNETANNSNFTSAYQWIKSVDSSRPVQYEPAGLGDNTDIFCPMYFSQKSSDEYASKSDVKKPLIQCEYSHAMGNSSGGFKEYWDLIRKYNHYQGGFIWDFADQALRSPRGFLYGGDYDPSDPSDNNFNCNGVFSPDRTPSPQAYEVRYQQQNIWTKDIDAKNGRISIYNENFFRPQDNVSLHWTIYRNGIKQTDGDVDIAKLNIQPQQSAEVSLPYHIDVIDGEVILDLSFRLKSAEPMLKAGHEVAHQQLVISDYHYGSAVSLPDLTKIMTQLQKNMKPATKPVQPAALAYENIRPVFWRAVTDNDMGADLQNKYGVWRNPKLELQQTGTASGKVLLNGKKSVITIMRNIYNMPDVHATLTQQYLAFPDGRVEFTQQFTPNADAKDVPAMLRYGITADLPFDAQQLEYYGRGPWENYSDRCSGSPINIYSQNVKDQFYPYSRPQSTGTKTDTRWLDIAGYRVSSDKAFSFSALNYTIDELDEGLEKQQRHPGDLHPNVPQNNVQLFIGEEAGVGGINSWSWDAQALPQYRLPFTARTLHLWFVPKN